VGLDGCCVLQALDAAQLVDIILTQPMVTLLPAGAPTHALNGTAASGAGTATNGPAADAGAAGPLAVTDLAPGLLPPALSTSVAFSALPRLSCTRDHAIVTDRGLVVGRIADPCRHAEGRIMEVAFRKLGADCYPPVLLPCVVMRFARLWMLHLRAMPRTSP
jgi:hypothetical protein